jgi:hypothetical protein
MVFRSLLVALILIKFCSAQSEKMQWHKVADIESPAGIVSTYTPMFAEIPFWGFGMKELTQQEKIYRFSTPGIQNLPMPKRWHTLEGPDANVIQRFFPPQWDTSICAIKPFWYVHEGEAIPVWSIRTCPSGVYGNREMIWSAEEHRVIDTFSHIAFYASDTLARALVFRPDPLTKAGVYYGGAFTDQQDADVPELNAQRDTVVIQISFINDSFRLKGPWVEIKDIELPQYIPVAQTDADFFFTRSQQGFEEVNAVYHIQNFQLYIRNLGFQNLCDFPLTVDAHGVQGADNSYFSPDIPLNGSYLSFGEGGVDDAEDADVIIHEYIHALSHCAAPESNLGAERRGLDEGMGDYFAAAMSYDISPFRSAEIYTWDGHNEFWLGRRTDLQAVYPLSNPNIYQNGALWASVMMANRFDLGALVADPLQLQAMYFNVQNNTLQDAARNILIADSLLFNAIHVPQLLWNFCRYGLLTGTECNRLTNHTPDKQISLPSVFPNPASETIFLNDCPAKWQLFNTIGQCILSGEQRYFSVQDIQPGIYTILFPESGLQFKLSIEQRHSNR